MSFYGNAADFRTYHEARGRTISPLWHADFIEAGLLVGSEWIDNRFGNVFTGYPTGGFTQERQWPRTAALTNTFPEYAISTSEIPTRVINATYEAAYRELSEPESLNVDFTPSEYKSLKIEGAIDIEYAGINQATEVQTQITIIEQLLAPLIDPNSSGSASALSGRIVRA